MITVYLTTGTPEKPGELTGIEVESLPRKGELLWQARPDAFHGVWVVVNVWHMSRLVTGREVTVLQVKRLPKFELHPYEFYAERDSARRK